MNREQRERYEQRLLLSRLSVHSLEGRGTLLLGLFLEPHWNYKGHSLLVRSKVSGDTPYLFAVFASFAVRIYNGYSFYFSAGQGNSNVTFLKKYSRKLDSYSLNMYIHMIALAGWIGLP